GLALSPDNRRLLIGFHRLGHEMSRTGSGFAVFDARSGRKLGEWSMWWQATAHFSPDGRMAVCHSDGIHLWEAATGQQRTRIPRPVGMSACQMAPDGRTLAVATGRGPVEIWDLSSDRSTGPTTADESWETLAGEAGEPAFAVICRLRSTAGEAVSFLKERMKVPAGPTAEWVADRLKGLDAALYRDRERASADLLRAGDLVAGQLWDALPTASPEARERLT